jgi:hypothetical protein
VSRARMTLLAWGGLKLAAPFFGTHKVHVFLALPSAILIRSHREVSW